MVLIQFALLCFLIQQALLLIYLKETTYIKMSQLSSSYNKVKKTIIIDIIL